MRLSDPSPIRDASSNALKVAATTVVRHPRLHRPSDRGESVDLAFPMAMIEVLQQTQPGLL